MSGWLWALLLMALLLVSGYAVSGFPLNSESPLFLRALFTTGAIITLLLAVWPLWFGKVTRSSAWWKAKESVEEITMDANYINRDLSAGTLTEEKRKAWWQKVRLKLDSQIDNTWLLTNDAALESWRGAQIVVKMALAQDKAEEHKMVIYLNADGTPSAHPVSPDEIFKMFQGNLTTAMNLVYAQLITNTKEPAGSVP